MAGRRGAKAVFREHFSSFDKMGKRLLEEVERKLFPTPEKLPTDLYENKADLGLCYVRPYWHNHSCFAKRRWIGRSVKEVYEKEFLEHPPSYFEFAVRTGAFKVNGRRTTLDYQFRESDLLSHKLHRHEHPVLSDAIQVLCETESLLVVNKPPSYMAHPTGRFLWNSIVGRLRYDLKLEFISPINRLDRLTSGVMLLAKNSKAAATYCRSMLDKAVSKEYVALVAGRFPHEQIQCDAPLCIAKSKMCLVSVADEPEGKSSTTIFQFLAFDEQSNTSLVLCKPTTGRTHQIRVHLQSLGHPIANDFLYNNPLWGQSPNQETQLGRAEFVASELVKHFGSDQSEMDQSFVDQIDSLVNFNNTPESRYYLEQLEALKSKNQAAIEATDFSDDCFYCKFPAAAPKIEKMKIFLHSFRYSISSTGEEYRAPLPKWASSLLPNDHWFLRE